MLDQYNNVITRPKNNIGYCNICDSFEKLTDDHVPPKGSTKITQVKMLSIHDALGVTEKEAKGRRSQNGVKFRTLCKKCNNEWLGTKYDPSLNHFSSELIKYVDTRLALPETIKIHSKPNLIARAVIGHMLAVGVNRSNKSEIVSHLARYFKNPTYTLPKRVYIYFWIYPHRKQILIRDAALVKSFNGLNKPISFMLMKYFPLAFMVTFDHPLSYPVASLNSVLNTNPEQERDIYVNLKTIPPSNFPEAPSSNGAVVYGNVALKAVPE